MKKDLKSSRQHVTKVEQKREEVASHSIEGMTPEQAALWQMVQGKSRQELQDTFYQTAREQMRKGTFDEAAVVKMIDSLGPMITPEQRSRMLQMLRSVRGGD